MRIRYLIALLPLCLYAQHDVTITWTASTTPGAAYNAYRVAGTCPSSGVFAKVNTTAITGTSYVDAARPAGTWCYLVKSLLNGVESAPSNQAQAIVPALVPLPPTNVTILPIAATVYPGRTLQFTATGGIPPYVWTLSPLLGAISDMGLYVAPARIQGNNIRVSVAASDGVTHATSQVTLRK